MSLPFNASSVFICYSELSFLLYPVTEKFHLLYLGLIRPLRCILPEVLQFFVSMAETNPETFSSKM